MNYLHNSEWWVKVAGKQSRTSLGINNEVVNSGAYSLGVAPLGSHMFPR